MPHQSFEKIKKTAQYGVSILNGIVGDKLQHTALGIEMGFFYQNKRIMVEQDHLLEYFAQYGAGQGTNGLARGGVDTTLTGIAHFTKRAESHKGFCHGGE